MPAFDPSEIGQWFEREAAALVLYARRWFNQAEAEEVVQDAFVRLMQQSRRPLHVRGWLYRTVRNGAISRIRSVSRRRNREESQASDSPDCFERHPGDLIDAGLAEQALLALPEDEREIVTLRIWSGMTLKEIAEIVGDSIPTVFRKYKLALGRLREEMQSSCRKTPN